MSTNADKVISTNARRWIVCEGCPYPLTCEAQGCIYPSDAVVTIAEPKSIITSPFSPDVFATIAHVNGDPNDNSLDNLAIRYAKRNP